MGKRLILLLFISLFMISLVSASPIAKIGDAFNITAPCDFTCSSLNITILYPNSSVLINNSPMINNVLYASYQITPSVFGEYNYFLYDGSNYSNGSFKATSTGYELTTQNSLIYLGLFGIIIFIFIATFFGIGMLPNSNSKDEQGKILSINYLKYFRSTLWFVEWMLFIALMYLSSNLAFAYLGEQLFAQILFVMFRIALGVTPIIVIVWVVWFFIKFFHDLEFQKVLNRGIFPQGNL